MQDQSAIREAYNQASQAYASKFIDELEGKPRDREMLQQFVKHIGQGRILDLGCGPGHTTAYIHSLGGNVTGIDLSPCMIEQAKQIFPDCEFEVGDFLALSAQTESFGGILAFYCIVHLEPTKLLRAFSEFYRILQNRGFLLLAFHVGNDVIRAENFLGTEAVLDFRFFETSHVCDALYEAGFRDLDVRVREPYPSEHPSQRCYILAIKRVTNCS